MMYRDTPHWGGTPSTVATVAAVASVKLPSKVAPVKLLQLYLQTNMQTFSLYCT